MGPREKYEARKAAEKAWHKQEAEEQERIAREREAMRRESELRRLWFFHHPDSLVRYTGWLQLYTAILSVATVALVGATIYSAFILHNTDEKIGKQAEIAAGQLKVIEGQLEEAKMSYEALKVQVTMEGPRLRLEDQAIFKVAPPQAENNEGPYRIPDRRLPDTVIVGITIQNVGRGSAEVSGYGIGWAVESSLQPTPVYVSDWDDQIFLMPNSPTNAAAAHKWRYLSKSPIRLTEQQRNDIASEQMNLWVYGYVCYQGPLGPVVHRFAGKWIGSPNTSIRGFIGDSHMPPSYTGDSQEACPHQ